MGAVQEEIVVRFMDAWSNGGSETPDIETIMFLNRALYLLSLRLKVLVVS